MRADSFFSDDSEMLYTHQRRGSECSGVEGWEGERERRSDREGGRQSSDRRASEQRLQTLPGGRGNCFFNERTTLNATAQRKEEREGERR